MARGPAGKKLALPGANAARSIRVARAALEFEPVPRTRADHYEYALPVPGSVMILELGLRIEARIARIDEVPEAERNYLIDPARVGGKLAIRNWQAGDRYWPAHTAREKKVKDLLAGLHATGARKKLWPVATNAAGHLVWLRGFAVTASLQPSTDQVVRIREIRLSC